MKLVDSVQMCKELGLDPPTLEQQSIIESDLQSALVVAGAGSGKTETVARRVMWLVVSGQLQADQILGLTFTRKAAGELAARVRSRLARLAEAGFLPGVRPEKALLCTSVSVSTYNAFANDIYRQNYFLLGHPRPREVLDSASLWLLARSVIYETGLSLASDQSQIPSVSSWSEALARLSDDLRNHDQTPEAVIDYAGRFIACLEGLSEATGRDGKLRADLADKYRRAEDFIQLAGLVKVLAQKKADLGQIEFADQVAYAQQICREHPRAILGLTERIRFVVLDEYQDISPVQVRLLKSLFGSLAVMGVGDPRQAIYGFRGASSQSMREFAREFGSDKTYALQTSWRNDLGVLKAANALSEQLDQKGARLGPRPGAGCGEVEAAIFTDEPLADAHLLDWLARSKTRGSCAVLARTHRQLEVLAQKLDRAGVDYYLVSGSVLVEPEVVDLWGYLRLLNEASATSSLIRLLAGARWQVEFGDLRCLKRLADRLAKAAKHKDRGLDLGINLLEALTYLLEANEGLDEFSTRGIERLREFARLLARFRQSLSLSLPELVRFVAGELNLESEVYLAGRSLESLAAFYKLVDDFVKRAKFPVLGEFLAWLERLADSGSGPALSPPGVEVNAIQLLTIHAAKGLEWDYVLLPELRADGLPAKAKSLFGWLSNFGALPESLRADRNSLPVFEWSKARSGSEFEARLRDYKDGLSLRHLQEERRLGYVAYTRARRGLALVARIGGNSEPKPLRDLLSPFLVETLAALESSPVLEASFNGQALPLLDQPIEPRDRGKDEIMSLDWPRDPLGSRTERVLAARQAFLLADAKKIEPKDHSLLEFLLAEAALPAQVLRIGNRISATSLAKSIIDGRDLENFAIPAPPAQSARLGSLFHQWVESYYSLAGETSLFESGFEFESRGPNVELERLKEQFLASAWAGRRPRFVELRLDWPVGSRVASCGIDAVFTSESKESDLVLVDWKTGYFSDKKLRRYTLQLSVYRLALAQWLGMDPGRIGAELFFVGQGLGIKIDPISARDLLAEMARIWEEEPGATGF